jgi:hypothetical protein
MRRSLVLTDEQARHPFRASLPPHVRGNNLVVPERSSWTFTRDDLHSFVGAYFACLAGVAVFIA